MCTHNLVEAQKLCDRVAVLEHGRLVLGEPAQPNGAPVVTINQWESIPEVLACLVQNHIRVYRISSLRRLYPTTALFAKQSAYSLAQRNSLCAKS
jgi:hypothetical protein